LQVSRIFAAYKKADKRWPVGFWKYIRFYLGSVDEFILAI